MKPPLTPSWLSSLKFANAMPDSQSYATLVSPGVTWPNVTAYGSVIGTQVSSTLNVAALDIKPLLLTVIAGNCGVLMSAAGTGTVNVVVLTYVVGSGVPF